MHNEYLPMDLLSHVTVAYTQYNFTLTWAWIPQVWNPGLCESRPYVRVATITQDNLLNIRYCHFLTACNCRAGPDLCFRLVVADGASLHVINSEFMKHRR